MKANEKKNVMIIMFVGVPDFWLCTSLFKHNYWLEHLECGSFSLAIVLFAYQISATILFQ